MLTDMYIFKMKNKHIRACVVYYNCKFVRFIWLIGRYNVVV